MRLSVNGKALEVGDLDPTTPLLWVLRDELGLKGTKFGCGAGLCGACTVHVDGESQRSCSVPISSIGAAQVHTIEGISGKQAEAVRAAWQKFDVPQCGYCQSGQIMSAVALLTVNPKPSPEEVDSAMSGNLCRCGTYNRIRSAITDASRQLA
jgi:isoquinoline 1-oxidoreductase alpha subunit